MKKLLFIFLSLLCSYGQLPIGRQTAALTYYISYAPCCPGGPWYDPNADKTECSDYSACRYLGLFAASDRKLSWDEVKNSNIIAFFDRRNSFSRYAKKNVRLWKNGKSLDAVILDTCGDADCNGCCSRNSDPSTGFLVDIEYWTALKLFNKIGDVYGKIEFEFIDAPAPPSPAPPSPAPPSPAPPSPAPAPTNCSPWWGQCGGGG